MITNIQYKDSVFRYIFNNEDKALELYKTIYNIDSDNQPPIKIVTLEDVLFTPRKNDLAFMIGNKFVILCKKHRLELRRNSKIIMKHFISE